MLELEDTQGVILSGYKHLNFARFLFVHFLDKDKGRSWLASVLPDVATSAPRPRGAAKPKACLNLAVSCEGLSALGLSDDTLQTAPSEFQEGMSQGARPRMLGDTGDSDPSTWEIGRPGTDPIHALVMFYGETQESLDALCNRYCASPDGWKELYSQDSDRTSAAEPFGFRDGMSQPIVEDVDWHAKRGGEPPIRAGEFMLGYLNEYDNYPPTITVAPETDLRNVLAENVHGGTRKDFGRNGSFLVCRKLAQDVGCFWKFAEETAGKLLGNADAAERDALKIQIAAKMVGRWPGGAPLVLSPDRDDPALQDANGFLYAYADPKGMRCPVGAHIRRSNPRDSLVPDPQTSSEVVRRHRLIRRGRPFGTPWTGTEDGQERGIVFIAINADIQRQFEFIQQTWVNSPKFEGLYNNPDPISGNNEGTFQKRNGTGEMILPGSPLRTRICGIPRFVQVRGGGYFFVPSMRALRYLAGGY